MIFTGPVDEFFDFHSFKLPYRCLEFKHETLNLLQTSGRGGQLSE